MKQSDFRSIFCLISFPSACTLTVLLVGLALCCRSLPRSENNPPTASLKNGITKSPGVRNGGEFSGVNKGDADNVSTDRTSAKKDTSLAGDGILPISWSFNPGQYRGKNGQQFTFRCPAGGSVSSVYGTDVYTDDSSVCTAAVHEGVISIAAGGVVTIRIQPGQDAFVGSERNGIKTSDFNNRWNGAFVLVSNTGGS
jgi:hypothetical protein